jgi:hypothetical protein
MESQCSFDLHFLMAKDAEHLFTYLLDICTSFENSLFNSFALLLIGLFFWCLIFWSSLYILDISPLSDEESAKIFLPIYRLSLGSGNYFLCCAEAFQFDAISFVNSCSHFLSN